MLEWVPNTIMNEVAIKVAMCGFLMTLMNTVVMYSMTYSLKKYRTWQGFELSYDDVKRFTNANTSRLDLLKPFFALTVNSILLPSAVVLYTVFMQIDSVPLTVFIVGFIHLLIVNGTCRETQDYQKNLEEMAEVLTFVTPKEYQSFGRFVKPDSVLYLKEKLKEVQDAHLLHREYQTRLQEPNRSRLMLQELYEVESKFQKVEQAFIEAQNELRNSLTDSIPSLTASILKQKVCKKCFDASSQDDTLTMDGEVKTPPPPHFVTVLTQIHENEDVPAELREEAEAYLDAWKKSLDEKERQRFINDVKTDLSVARQELNQKGISL